MERQWIKDLMEEFGFKHLDALFGESLEKQLTYCELWLTRRFPNHSDDYYLDEWRNRLKSRGLGAFICHMDYQSLAKWEEVCSGKKMIFTQDELFQSQAPLFNFELNADELLKTALKRGFVSKLNESEYLINQDYKGVE